MHGFVFSGHLGSSLFSYLGSFKEKPDFQSNEAQKTKNLFSRSCSFFWLCFWVFVILNSIYVSFLKFYYIFGVLWHSAVDKQCNRFRNAHEVNLPRAFSGPLMAVKTLKLIFREVSRTLIDTKLFFMNR